MKTRLMAAIVFAVLIMGCTQQSQMPMVDVTNEDSSFSRQYVSVVLPQGVELDFPYELVSERLFTRDDNGETRRGLLLEFTEGAPASLASSIKAGFGKAGYRVRGTDATKPDGQVSFTVTKQGAVAIYAEIRPAGDRKLSTQGAKGTIWLSWSVRPGSERQ